MGSKESRAKGHAPRKLRFWTFCTANGELDLILRANARDTLIMLGYATSGVVLSTVRAAADLDYRVVVVEDCCADQDADVHNFLTQRIFPRQAEVVTSDEVIQALTA